MSPGLTEVAGAVPGLTTRCEIAIVGSGPGGAITACLLAEAGRDVLLIEEGSYLPIDSCAPFSMEELVLKYRNGGLTAALGPVKIQYVEGRCVGGGSEINSGLYHRTPPAILDEWTREFGVEGLSEQELRPHFEACETDLSVGPWLGEAPAATRKLGEGARRLNWKFLEVPRWVKYEAAPGGGPLKARRQSMTETYVPRALRAGCRLLPDTRVRRLRRDNGTGRWTVQAEQTAAAGRRHAVTIEAETVFVCGGAIQTPALLRRSGPTTRVLCPSPRSVRTAASASPPKACRVRSSSSSAVACRFAPALSTESTSTATPTMHLIASLLSGQQGAGHE